MADRYHFSFSWQSSYGHLVQLVDRLRLQPGLVIDLGCGHAAVAEPLAGRGFTYVGADVEAAAVEAVAARGFEASELDLADVAHLPEHLVKLADGRPVAAVLLLDVLEHLYPTAPFLDAVREALDDLGRPPLLVSVPNVAHVDIAAKLVFGRWDYTPTGLLDDTHVSFFTEQRLADAMRSSGLVELARNDFLLPHSDQHFPASHPALAKDSPVAQLLQSWRAQADDLAVTNQFVRAFVPLEVTEDVFEEPVAHRFLTVIMRTQGRRPDTLREALTCLAAQTEDDFDVLLLVHDDDLTSVDVVASLVGEFHSTFAHRVSVVGVTGGGRSRPLNEGLARATSDYVAFLDDDDLVTANWIEEFRGAADGRNIVRSTTVEQHVSAPLPGEQVPYHLDSGLLERWVVPFDLGQHLWQNHTPICSFAIPLSVVDAFRLRFDEDLPVIEDWHFLLRAAMVAPVRDTGEITSIYRRWQRGESSTTLHDEDLWRATHRAILERLDATPLVLPAGSASKLSAAWHDRVVAEHESHMARVQNEVLRDRVDALERSRWWRMTRPAARAVERQRALAVRTKSKLARELHSLVRRER